MQRLKMLVHGDAGVVKSWLGASTPGPRLILDAEGGSHFAKARNASGEMERPPAIEWSPLHTEPPTGLTSNDSVFVRVRSMEDIVKALAWLQSGQHEFKSVVLDSLTDIQLTARYDIRDGQKREKDVTDMRSWGILLDQMIEICRDFRDLTDHQTNPLWAVLVLAGSEQVDGQWRPQVQGGLSRRLAGYFDVVGFLQNEVDFSTQTRTRRMHLVQAPSWKAKDRTDDLTQNYGDSVDNPDVRAILSVLNATKESKSE